eukprot:g4629.t1
MAPFLMRTHPDTLHDQPAAVRKANERSLQLFNAFLDLAQSRCGSDTATGTPAAASIDTGVFPLRFYLRDPSDGAAAPSCVTHTIDVPSWLCGAEYADTGGVASRQWTDFTARELGALLRAGGLSSAAVDALRSCGGSGGGVGYPSPPPPQQQQQWQHRNQQQQQQQRRRSAPRPRRRARAAPPVDRSKMVMEELVKTWAGSGPGAQGASRRGGGGDTAAVRAAAAASACSGGAETLADEGLVVAAAQAAVFGLAWDRSPVRELDRAMKAMEASRAAAARILLRRFGEGAVVADVRALGSSKAAGEACAQLYRLLLDRARALCVGDEDRWGRVLLLVGDRFAVHDVDGGAGGGTVRVVRLAHDAGEEQLVSYLVEHVLWAGRGAAGVLNADTDFL